MNTLIIAMVVIPVILVVVAVTIFLGSVIASAIIENKAARTRKAARDARHNA